MNITKQLEAAEAVCAALYETGWEFLGETDGQASTWFRRGEKPKIVRVEVQRSRLAEYVLIKPEWLNLSLPDRVIKGQEVLQIDCGKYGTDATIKEATTQAVVRCLEILRDVVSGQGVAGRESLENLTFD